MTSKTFTNLNLAEVEAYMKDRVAKVGTQKSPANWTKTDMNAVLVLLDAARQLQDYELPAPSGVDPMPGVTLQDIVEAPVVRTDKKRKASDDTLRRAVEAIRADKKVGRGSCSTIDECMSDSELVRQLMDDGITSVKAALAWAKKTEKMFLDQEMNALDPSENAEERAENRRRHAALK